MQAEESHQNGSADQMLTLNEVAQLLRVHPNSLRRWADQGLIRTYRIGVRGDRRFRSEDVSSFLDACESSGPSTPKSSSSNTRHS